MPKLTSSAFRSGFAAGFSAPYRSLFGARVRFAPRYRNLLTESWEQVGQSMRVAIEKEQSRHGKASFATTDSD